MNREARGDSKAVHVRLPAEVYARVATMAKSGV